MTAVVGDVLNLLFITAVHGLGGGHELLVGEAASDGGSGGGCGCGLNLPGAVAAPGGARGQGGALVGEVEIDGGAAQAQERGVVGVGGLLRCAVGAEPNAFLRDGLSDLGYPLPPASHPHAAVLALGRHGASVVA